jgi:tetratricopeptide (TPR) repeat protein
MATPELAGALAAVGFKDPYEVFASFLMSNASVRDWAQGGAPLNDDLPWAEFEAPKMVYAAKVPDSVATIEPHIISPGVFFKPGTISEEDLALVERRHLAHRNDFAALKPYYGGFSIDSAASSAFMRSLEIDPNDYNARGYLKQLIGKQAEAFLGWEEFDKLEAVLSQAIVFMPDDLDFQLIWGDLYHAKGDVERARAEYKRYIEMGGTEPRAKQRASD